MEKREDVNALYWNTFVVNKNKQETSVKKQYTRKQIKEAIAYWKKQLNEDISYSGNIYNLINEIKDVLVSLSDYVNTLE